MSHFHDPSKLMCLACGTLCVRVEGTDFSCEACESSIDADEVLGLYEYAAEVYYYGRQYRSYYERAYATDRNPPKPSLEFAGEAFAWVMLAVLSGVLGNAAYDTIKLVVAKVLADVAAGKIPDRDYSPMLELTDDELGQLVDAARTYLDGMEGLTREVRSAIVEEIMADTVAHDPLVAAEMMKLMQREKIKDKHRKKFAELLRGAIVRSRERTKPRQGAFVGLWSRVAK